MASVRLDERGSREVATRHGRVRKKLAPLLAGLIWSLACLFVEEFFRSSCCYPNAVFVMPLDQEGASAVPDDSDERVGFKLPKQALGVRNV
jgi:hypothetical protein